MSELSDIELKKIVDIHELIDKIDARIDPQQSYLLNHLPASEFAELEELLIEQIKIWLMTNKI